MFLSATVILQLGESRGTWRLRALGLSGSAPVTGNWPHGINSLWPQAPALGNVGYDLPPGLLGDLLRYCLVCSFVFCLGPCSKGPHSGFTQPYLTDTVSILTRGIMPTTDIHIHLPGIVLRISYPLSHLIFTTLEGRKYYYAHFTEETETQ